MTNESQSFQEAYKTALTAFETAAFPEFFFDNVSAQELIKANELADVDEDTAQEALDTLKRNLNKLKYCARCESEIVFHADFSFQCSCASLEEEETEIPRFWSLTESERSEQIEAEKEYIENE